MIVINFFFPDYITQEFSQLRVPTVPSLTINGTVPSLYKPQEDPKYAPEGITPTRIG